MVELLANSGDPLKGYLANSADSDHAPRSAASDLGLHYLPNTLSGFPAYNGLIQDFRFTSESLLFLKRTH